MKKEKEKEPEKLDKMENSAVPKKKGFEEEHKDSDDDSSDDEQVRPRPLSRQTGEATPLSRQTGEATPLVGETGSGGQWLRCILQGTVATSCRGEVLW